MHAFQIQHDPKAVRDTGWLAMRQLSGTQILLHLAQSSFGILSSILGNIVIFILVARSMGPGEFGAFALAYATASIAGIIFDFGYMIRLLRETHTLSGRLPARALWLKATLFAVLTAGLLGLAAATGLDLALVAVVWTGIALISLANLFATMLRAIDLHARDARNLFVANVIGAMIAMLGTVIGLPALGFAAIFGAIGAIYLTQTLLLWSRHFTLAHEAFTRTALFHEVRSNLAYVLDAIGQRGFGFLDVVILSAVASPAVVGLYQAGQKVAQGANVFAQPFGNVILPRLSAVATKPSEFRRRSQNFFLLQSAAGVIVFLALAGIGPVVINLIYTSAYEEVQSWMWAFGMLVGVRYAAGSLMMRLTALGYQTQRMIINIVGVAILGVAGLLLAQTYGAIGMIFGSMIASLWLGAAAFALGQHALRKLEARK